MRADDSPSASPKNWPPDEALPVASLVPAALVLRDFLGDVGQIDEARLVEVRMVVEQHDQVGAGAGLNARRDARLQIVAVDGFELDLDAERLFRLGKQLGLAERHRKRERSHSSAECALPSCPARWPAS